MNLIEEFEENEKNFKDEQKSSDSSIHSQLQQIDISSKTLKKNLTSLNKVRTYFNFFMKFLHQSSSLIHPKHHRGFHHSQLNKISQAIDQQSLEQVDIQSNQNPQIPLNTRTHQFLFQYQDSHRQNLEEILLKSKRFKKMETFTNQLTIKEILPSKHYEIIKLDVQLMWYRTEICLLNDLQKSPLKTIGKVSASGAFGLVYFVKVMDEYVAIKCIHFTRQESNKTIIEQLCKEMRLAIKEYFFLLLFSELRVGPQTKTIGGFDMIIYSDFIQFATQICQIPQKQNVQKMKRQLSESLFKMHMLNVVHKDIKPTNILYSPQHKRHVFIDFGCSDVLKEILGEITHTHFVGTTGFCSLQMLSLLSKKGGNVDLYFNDFVGLRKSLKKQWKTGLKQQRLNMNQMNNSFFKLEYLMYLLYTDKFDKFQRVWNFFCTKQPDSMQEIQMKLLHFFSQLKISTELRQFYWKQIDDSIREMEQFKQPNEMMKTNTFELLSQFTTYPTKQKQFSFFQLFYRKLVIECGDFTKTQKQIENSIVNTQSIEEFLANLHKKINNNICNLQEINDQLIKMTLIVVLYTSIASNHYNTTIEDKIETCSVALEILKNQYEDELKNIDLIFESGIQNLKLMARFHQYFIFYFWHLIPKRYKSRAQLHCIVTLCLLGYPNTQNPTYYLVGHSITKKYRKDNINKHNDMKIGFGEDKIRRENDDNINEFKDYNPNTLKEMKKIGWEQKLQQICWFWQRKLLMLIFVNVFYNRDKTKIKLNNVQSFREQIQTQQKYIMSAEGETYEVFTINYRFYKDIIIQFLSFNQNSFKYLFSLINLPSIIELEQNFSIVKKWRSLIRLLLCFFSLTFRIKNLGEILWRLNKQTILSQEYKDTILPYAFALFISDTLKIHTRLHIFAKFDNAVNCLSVSSRFKIQKRLNLALQIKNFRAIQEILIQLQQQISVSQFLLQQNPLLTTILQMLYRFLDNYVQQLPTLSQQSYLLFKKCYGFVNLAIQIGQNHYKMYRKIFPANDFSVEGLNEKMIFDALFQSRSIRLFFLTIIKVGKIYTKISKRIEMQDTYTKCQFSLESRHQQFLKMISQNHYFINFTSQWFNLLQHPQIKSTIKQSHLLLEYLLKMFMSDRQSIQDIFQGEKLLEHFFKRIHPNDYKTYNEKNILPTLQIAFDYFQVKLLKTNYGLEQCEQIINLYKICVKNECFSIFEKKGLIRSLFHSYIYLKKKPEQILELIQQIARNLWTLPQKARVKQFTDYFNSFFWCRCESCFLRPPQHWNPQELINLLYTRLKQFNTSNNSYMALVYFYSLDNNKIEAPLLQKIIKFILRSITYISPQARKVIMSKLYILVFLTFQLPQRQAFFEQKGIKNSFITLNNSKSQMNFRVHRRFLYNFFLQNKNQPSVNDSIEMLIQKRLVKETYFKGYTFPPLIKSNYIKKIRRYYEVKQNYKQDGNMRQFLNQKYDLKLTL